MKKETCVANYMHLLGRKGQVLCLRMWVARLGEGAAPEHLQGKPNRVLCVPGHSLFGHAHGENDRLASAGRQIAQLYVQKAMEPKHHRERSQACYYYCYYYYYLSSMVLFILFISIIITFLYRPVFPLTWEEAGVSPYGWEKQDGSKSTRHWATSPHSWAKISQFATNVCKHSSSID